MTCECCGKPGNFTIVVASGEHSDELLGERIYLPNQHARKHKGVLRKMAFCKRCMRKVEDAVRAQVLYLRAENGKLITLTVQDAA